MSITTTAPDADFADALAARGRGLAILTKYRAEHTPGEELATVLTSVLTDLRLIADSIAPEGGGDHEPGDTWDATLDRALMHYEAEHGDDLIIPIFE